MKKLFVLLCFVFIIGSAIPSAFADIPSSSKEVITQPYSYPIVTDSDWKNMTRDERLEACQIPNDVIDKMTTDALFNSILNNPFMIDILAFDNYNEGFKKVYEEIQALQCLIKRGDFSSVFMINCKLLNSKDSIVNKRIKLIYSSILLVQPDIEGILTLADKEAIIDSFNNNTALTGSVKDNIVAATTTHVHTPEGTEVTVYNQSGITDWTASEKSDINAQWLAAYPNILIVSNPTKKYNCHSYAWYSTSTSNYYWMDDPSAYMSDGSYDNVSQSTMLVGDKVHWNNGSHSGIVKGVGQSSCKFVSKWGPSGVYIHYPNDCPYSGSVSRWRR